MIIHYREYFVKEYAWPNLRVGIPYNQGSVSITIHHLFVLFMRLLASLGDIPIH